MCLIVCAFRVHPACPLVLAANRDEFHDRPARAAAFWEDAPELLAGRDLKAGGTWLGVTRRGRVAAVTNYRELEPPMPAAESRGRLVTDFLVSEQAPAAWLEELAPGADRFAGFSLLVAAAGGLGYFSNREDGHRLLPPGVYGMSNHLLETPWPKVVHSKRSLERLLDSPAVHRSDLLDMLADRRVPGDAALPETGLGERIERLLLPAFIVGERYGTRSTAAVTISREGELKFAERSFRPDGTVVDEQRYTFPVPGWRE